VVDLRDDEFYVGYLPRAPRGIAARVRWATAALGLVAAAVAVLLVHGQRGFDPGTHEYGVVREFRGVIRERPYPLLQLPRPGRPDRAVADSASDSTYYLTARGKAGAAALVAGLDGRPVRLRGSLVHRDALTMVEIAGEVEPLAGQAASELEGLPAPPVADLGERTLTGEIVDSKCFLGVMKPGHLKPHRDCAARCISGGIPPLLVVRDGEGRATSFLLVSAAGEPLGREVLPLVAEPVEIRGRVERVGELLVLRADPGSYRRL